MGEVSIPQMEEVLGSELLMKGQGTSHLTKSSLKKRHLPMIAPVIDLLMKGSESVLHMDELVTDLPMIGPEKGHPMIAIEIDHRMKGHEIVLVIDHHRNGTSIPRGSLLR